MMSMKRVILGGVALLAGIGVVAGPQTYAASHHTASHAAKTTTVASAIANGRFVFKPAKTTVAVGTKVIWTNHTQAPHTVTSETSSWKFKKNLNQNATVSFVFHKAGTYKYRCTIHPGMVGTIVVK